MKHVYIVTSGSYSDYSIRAVFTRKADAEALIAEWNEEKDYRANDASVEEWLIDDEVRPDERYRRIRVLLDENGNTVEVSDREANDGKRCTSTTWWTWREVKRGWPRPDSPKRIEFTGTVWARNEDHAIKMGRDARAASIAAGDLDRLKAPEPKIFYLQATHDECREHTDCLESFTLGQACASGSRSEEPR